jgi:hypothetical protein
MSKWPSEADLNRYCERWQEMLRLQHWKLKVRYGRAREMVSDENGSIAWGRCMVNENHLRAKMLILHPDDYEDDEGRQDIEVTIVHELLHVLMHPLRREAKYPDVPGDVAEEQVINVTSELLVDLFHDLCMAEARGAKRQRRRG